MKPIAYFPLFILLMIVSGCTTLADSVADRGNGAKRVYDRSFDQVWTKTVESIPAVGLDLVSSDTTQNMILAQRGVTAFSYGENVAVFVEQLSSEQCLVEVVSKRAMATNVIAPDWSWDIFKYLNDNLGVVGVSPEKTNSSD